MKTKCNCLFTCLIGFCLCFAWKREKKKYINQNIEKEKVIHKQEGALETYKLWICLYQQNKKIENYLLTNNFRSVAIYGMGRIGRNLYKELSESEVNIDYIIDRQISISKGNYQSTLCYNPNSLLPKTDLIIITISSEADDIALYLSKSNLPVISIQDLFYRMISEM